MVKSVDDFAEDAPASIDPSFLGTYWELAPYFPVEEEGSSPAIEMFRIRAPKYFLEPKVAWNEFETLHVMAFSVKDIPEQFGLDRYEAAYVFRDMLAGKVREAGLFRRVTTERKSSFASGKDLQLEGRFLILMEVQPRGPLGGEGAVIVYLESRIASNTKPIALFKFAHARWRSVRGLDSMKMVFEDLADVMVAMLSRKVPFQTDLGQSKP